jgi:hypothetical protein
MIANDTDTVATRQFGNEAPKEPEGRRAVVRSEH